jgi:cobalt-zinc-cadmium resistance protein CzcA
VLDVSGFGGLTKEYHVDLDPAKLTHYAIALSQVIAAIQNSNTNSGGSYLNVGQQAFDVRGLGLIHSLDDISNVVLATNKSHTNQDCECRRRFRRLVATPRNRRNEPSR